WIATFNRAGEVLPGFSEEHSGTHRGKQKRHKLIEYCRQHPEELRPYKRATTPQKSAGICAGCKTHLGNRDVPWHLQAKPVRSFARGACVSTRAKGTLRIIKVEQRLRTPPPATCRPSWLRL